MKNSSYRKIFCFLVAVVLISQSTACTRNIVDPYKLKFPPLKFEVPKVDRIVLENGMIIYLLEDHTLPILDFYAVIRTGEIYEPADKAGLAALTGSVMRTGGTKNMTGDKVDETLEYIAATVEVDISREKAIAILSVLKDKLDTALNIYADILMNPNFEQKKIELKKAELQEEFLRQNDDPDEILGREFRRLLYRDHPYARRISGYPETIQKITRQDLIEFHKKYFHPNNIILGVAGDFEKDEIIAKLNETFADWQPAETDFVEPPEIKYDFNRSLNFIEKDLNQSSFYLGHIGLERLNPDYFAVYVMNFILGSSGFNSRLMENVRTKAGLAYAVGSYLHFPHCKGFLLCYCYTKTETSYTAVAKILDELEQIRSAPVTDDEFRRAKGAIKNRFVFRFQTSRSIVTQLVDIEYEGLPRNYLETYLDNIDRVTKEDILTVAKKYIHPDKITLVIVGNKNALNTFPKEFGEFKTIELE